VGERGELIEEILTELEHYLNIGWDFPREEVNSCLWEARRRLSELSEEELRKVLGGEWRGGPETNWGAIKVYSGDEYVATLCWPNWDLCGLFRKEEERD
jgi:hypothetical protein